MHLTSRLNLEGLEEDLPTCLLQVAMTGQHLGQIISGQNAIQQQGHDSPPIAETPLCPLGPTDTIPQATQGPECAELLYTTVPSRALLPQPELSFSFFPWLSAINPSRVIKGTRISQETLPRDRIKCLSSCSRKALCVLHQLIRR